MCSQPCFPLLLCYRAPAHHGQGSSSRDPLGGRIKRGAVCAVPIHTSHTGSCHRGSRRQQQVSNTPLWFLTCRLQLPLPISSSSVQRISGTLGASSANCSVQPFTIHMCCCTARTALELKEVFRLHLDALQLGTAARKCCQGLYTSCADHTATLALPSLLSAAVLQVLCVACGGPQHQAPRLPGHWLQ